MRGLLAFVLFASCGELAVDGDYRGEALFTFGGTVRLEPSALESEATGELQVAVFWALPSGGALFSTVGAVEQQVDATTSFPARFALTLHRPPEAALVATTPDVSGAYAVAMVLVYLDQDGDARWDRETEPLVGAASDTFLVYAPDGLTGGRFGVLATGFHLLRADREACVGGSVEADVDAVQLTVSGTYPKLLDVDCDGRPNEWTGTCPDLSAVYEECRGEDDEGGDVCETCEGLLWSDDDTIDCDEWRRECERVTNDEECRRAADRCKDDRPH